MKPHHAEANKNYINRLIADLPDDYKGQIGDTYHTFSELYEHRCLLWIYALGLRHKIHHMGGINYEIWRSKKHSDGSVWDGWFVLGIDKEKGKQMTYHLPVKYWDLCEFAETLEQAPEFDGHTSADVLNRLTELLK